MPTYEYRCHRCGAREDFKLPVESRDQKFFCECGTQLTRVFNPVGVVFKGSGFYHTDARRASGRSDSSERLTDSRSDSRKVPDG